MFIPLNAWIVDGVRTPFGRYGGALATVRSDDLAALPIRDLVRRHPGVDWQQLDDVLLGCANQAGEDNRNVARMAALLAGLPETVPGCTVNRLCGSGLDAVAIAPPFGLTWLASSGSPNARSTASACAAKASFTSITSTSSMCQPSRASSFWLADTGPMPMMRGASPVTTAPTTRARAVS